MAQDSDKGRLSRRAFVAGGAVAAAGLAGLRTVAERQGRLQVREHAENGLNAGLSIIHGDADREHEREVVTAMTRRSIEALGGMGRLVSKGNSVVVKPNIAWVWGPDMATNTNPWVVAALVEMCREAGASRVRVMDNTIAKDPSRSYQESRIKAAAEAAGAAVPYVDLSRTVELEIPDGYELDRWQFCREFVDADTCDVLINVPILKDHGTSRLSMGFKNAFGMTGGDRGKLHPQIHRKMVDLHRVIKVDLTVLDCYRVLRTHGPNGGTLEDVDNTREGARRVVASRDPVAVDAYGAWMFGYGPEDVANVAYGEQAGMGTADWQSLDVLEDEV
jgi:uncharacterized protein (DUF362 family)